MENITLARIAQALGGEVAGGQVLCPGPNHSADDRSLSVTLGDNGDLVVNSFAGDDPIVCKDYVRERCGLPAWKPNGQTNGSTRPRVIAEYVYKLAYGSPYLRVARTDTKQFWQSHWDGKQWVKGKPAGEKIPYRLPELAAATEIFVTEGEKDADRLASLGFAATTSSEGAGKWRAELNKHFKGKDVVILPDNDGPGRKHAQDVAGNLYGVAASVRVLELPGLPEKGDVSDWLDAGNLPENLKHFVEKAPQWTPAAAENPKEPPLAFLNLAAWQDQAVPEREWAVRDRIPAKNVTLLSGEGAVGKTLLALHLCSATVLGRDWLSALPDPGPALAICCEDDADELHRRLDLIRQHYGANFSDLKELHALSLAGEDAIMATPQRNGVLETTPMFKRFLEAACDIRPKLIVLDNAADVYAGNENDRAQVRQFVGMLRKIAMSANAAVLLTSHPSLTGINTGSGMSGSTAWNASVRSRLYFKRATTEKDEEPDPDLRVLEVMKNNYGPVGEKITLRWSNGLFLPVPGETHIEKMAAEQTAEHVFLELLTRFERDGRATSDKKKSENYAPSKFAQEPEAKVAKLTKAALTEAMRRLFASGKITMEPYGKPSNGYSKMVIRTGN